MTNTAPPAPAQPKRQRPASAPRWHGALEGLHEGLLYGWAIDGERPNARVVLEVCLDEIVLGSVIADVARSDLAPVFAEAQRGAAYDDCHGFVADLGHFSEKEQGMLSVRVANTDVQLAGKFARNAAVKPPAAASSQVFSDGALRLHGWAKDPASAQRNVTVRAFIGHEQIAETTANLAHPSMRAYDTGSHGFDLALPISLADGKVHTVRVLDQDGNALNGSPLTICCFASGVKTLLPAQPDNLLHDVVDVYERYVPRSMAMAHYPAWAARFEHGSAQEHTPETAGSVLRFGFLIGGDGSDTAASERSAASVRQLGGAQADVKIYVQQAQQPFAALLGQALADGCDAVACVRAGDTLAPHTLACIEQGFALPHAQLVYTDSEHAGQPWFKPAWNPDYALASDYPLELLVVRSDVLRAGAAQAGLPDDPASLAWRALTALWHAAPQAIVHVPRVLYQFHSVPGAAERTARDAAARDALHALDPRAVLTTLTAPAHALYGARRVEHTLSAQERAMSVSLIIPTRDRIELLERAISTIQQYTQWDKLEIIVIDNGSTEAKTKTYFRKIAKQGVTVLPMPGPFNFAELNNRAIDAARGDIIGMINNDIEALHDGWLDEIIGQLLRPGVGAVGAKLLWPNGMVQHGGVLLGVGNVAGHFGNRLADADWGDHGRNQLLQQVSGVTAACLFMRKADFITVGGMDPHAFPVAFNDVDLCLKIRRAGKAIVWTPYARMLHAESASRGHEDTPQKRARSLREIDQLRQRWGAALLRDPAYHPSLNLDPHSHAFGGLAMPPRPRHPRLGELFNDAPVPGAHNTQPREP